MRPNAGLHRSLTSGRDPIPRHLIRWTASVFAFQACAAVNFVQSAQIFEAGPVSQTTKDVFEKAIPGTEEHPLLTGTELSAFATGFPSGNFDISSNLLGENNTRTRDTGALTIVTGRLTDPAFESVKSHLTTMHQGLEVFGSQPDSHKDH